jgi:phosphonoacetate hydrolase
MPTNTIDVNARPYRLPARPTVAITVDGCDPRYLDDAMAREVMPRQIGRAHV